MKGIIKSDSFTFKYFLQKVLSIFCSRERFVRFFASISTFKYFEQLILIHLLLTFKQTQLKIEEFELRAAFLLL